MSCTDLLVIRIERRTISIAAFAGIRLDYTQSRELSSEHGAAMRSARSFITWAYETFQPDLVVLEAVRARPGTRRDSLAYTVRRTLFRLLTTRTEVDPGSIRDAYGVPAPRTRSEIRKVVRTLWPELPGRATGSGPLDAAAVGLAFQMRAVFSPTRWEED